jgi:transposase-like protein
VYPKTQEQRCWVHKIANVLDKLPKRMQPRAKDMLHEIMRAPDRHSAVEDIERFTQEYQVKYPKAVETLTKDQDELLTFFDFPAEHWIHREGSYQESQGHWFPQSRTRDGLQVAAGRRETLA